VEPGGGGVRFWQPSGVKLNRAKDRRDVEGGDGLYRLRLTVAGNVTARRGKCLPRRAVKLPAAVNRRCYMPAAVKIISSEFISYFKSHEDETSLY